MPKRDDSAKSAQRPAAGPAGGPRWSYAQVVAKAWADPEFKEQFLKDPKAVLEQHGVPVPADLDLQAVADEPGRQTLVLPPKPDELADEQLGLAALAAGVSSNQTVASFPCVGGGQGFAAQATLGTGGCVGSAGTVCGCVGSFGTAGTLGSHSPEAAAFAAGPGGPGQAPSSSLICLPPPTVGTVATLRSAGPSATSSLGPQASNTLGSVGTVGTAGSICGTVGTAACAGTAASF